MDEQVDLSLALVHLLQAWATVRLDFSKAQALAEQAMVLASRCPDTFVSRGIRAHVLGYFYYDPFGCIEVLGDVDALDDEENVLGLFTSALGRFCTGEYDRVLESLDVADRIEPKNPFIAFLKTVALDYTRSPDARSAVDHFQAQHGVHPLGKALKSILPNR